jgi:SAM-dependent methyltransferase
MTTERNGAADWETFARRDPQYYIDPTLGPGVELETFREGGRGVVEWALGWAVDLPGRGRALEIGCGVGRNTVHLARHFAHVDGVDVSPTMVNSARQRGMAPNVRLHALSGRDLAPLPDASYDLVFSHLVFQHIAAEADVASYLRESARVLRSGGVAVLQFDTRPNSTLVSLFQRLPDAALPRDRRRSIRRHRRSAQAIRAAGAAGGLRLEAEQDPATADHFMRWRKP